MRFTGEAGEYRLFASVGGTAAALLPGCRAMKGTMFSVRAEGHDKPSDRDGDASGRFWRWGALERAGRTLCSGCDGVVDSVGGLRS